MGVNKNNVKIHVEHLKKNFGKLEVLKDVSTDIYEGEVVVILGPSGSGKSTFLRCLNRLEIPSSGSIKFEGVEVDDDHIDAVRQKMGMVFQHFNLFPHLTVKKNLELAPSLLKLKDKEAISARADELLARVGLADKANAYPKSLSGGQQQRLCIARAMAVSPSVLLMDEPASALDPISTAKVEELIHELKKEYTIVIVTHNMQQAARVSDKTAFFYMGNMVEYDDTKKIFTNPGKEATQNYITGRFG